MPVKTVDAATLKQWLARGEAVLVDVREPAEYNAEHIVGAHPIPLGGIGTAKLPARDGKNLVIHCLKGGRGASACEKLLAEDPALEICNLAGGIDAWTASGFAVEKSGAFFLPLDRQVQLTIGVCLVLASALACFASPVFLLVTAFFGAGLTVAGLTGFCGLARIMAAVPWNQRTG